MRFVSISRPASPGKKKPTGPKASGRTVAGDPHPVPTEEEIGERIQATRSGSASSGQMARQSSGRRSRRVTAPAVARSMAVQ